MAEQDRGDYISWVQDANDKSRDPPLTQSGDDNATYTDRRHLKRTRVLRIGSRISSPQSMTASSRSASPHLCRLRRIAQPWSSTPVATTGVESRKGVIFLVSQPCGMMSWAPECRLSAVPVVEDIFISKHGRYLGRTTLVELHNSLEASTGVAMMEHLLGSE
ncbi:uncharacterized protein ATNIH1004_010874 [Aspergillus tanneri]|uniref:Uncharacterized protein n=1 Tax=Aspergillus tanneri TaxID=1220188 RepID=A0A5M9M4L2_9EURO|nr:uncharacterized protein ATNIH1004_010874 [Aspergillus tanneri]KAA8641935.1 hypothetical protein ATNIH1004_010874 [Aspergillus tanneri]